MAVISQIDYKNVMKDSQDWTCEIFDILDPTPNGFTFNLLPGGVELQYEGDTRDIRPGVSPCTAYVRILINSGFMESIIALIRTSVEDRFSIKLYREGVLHFVGLVMMDTSSVVDAYFPYEFELTASCGLARLRNVDYNDDGTRYTGYETIQNHIMNCLLKAGVDSYYTGNFLSVSCNWYEQQMTATTLNPLTVASVSNLIWSPKDNEYASCFDVLNDICKVFNARLRYVDGMFQFEQLNNRINATFRRFYYNTAGTLTSTDNAVSLEKAHDATKYTFLTGQTETFMSALRKVEVTLKIPAVNSLDTGIFFDETHEDFHELGTFVFESAGSRMHFQGSIFTETSLTLGGQQEIFPHCYKFTLLFRFTEIDSGVQYWLLRETNSPFSNDYNPNPPYTWETALDYSDLVSRPLLGAFTDRVTENTPFSFSVGFPGSIGDTFTVTVQVAFDQIIWNEFPGNAAFTHDWEIPNLRITYKNRDQEGNVIALKYTATNSISNSDAIILEAPFGDKKNHPKGIQVLNASGDWVYANDWAVDAVGGAGVPFLQLLARRIAALRINIKKVINGGLIGFNISTDDRYTHRDGKIYLFLSGAHKTGSDVIDGTWVEIDEDDDTGLTDGEDVLVSDEDDPVQFPIFNGDPPIYPGPADNTYDLELDETLLGSETGVTNLTIVNTLGVFVEAGEFIEIHNQVTGQSEIVQLSADLEPGDISISIESHNFTFPFNDGDPISIAGAANPDWSENAWWNKYIEDYSGADYVVQGVTLPDPSVRGKEIIRKRVIIYRDGVKMKYDPSPTRQRHFSIDFATNKIVAATAFPFDVEDLELQILRQT